MSEAPEPEGTTNPVMTVRGVQSLDGVSLGRYLWVWCPGCDDVHVVVAADDDGTVPAGNVWDFDGDLEHPTIDPSIKVTSADETGPTVCHSFIRVGRWEFLDDCTHPLAGQSVDMVPVPDWLVAEATS